ncbi:hypothetical protein [Dyadobacter sp. CY356]|uniref:hypothetical protein n=1 Tax=Dyadobacter sp. CY356 TaxID=2906442 RepID=UPI001F1A3FC7|nr:hypothetical protein [Dyadobacter sp. CY356]MCF0057146.1 hypothetical protein [Dyadobacter sp. CY356]
MVDHIYLLPEPNERDPDADFHFAAGPGKMPAENDLLNTFSNNISETIDEYFEDSDIFDPFAPEKQIDDVYLYFIFNYLRVLQDYIHEQVTKNSEARFIILHFDYFYGHFARTVKGETRKIQRTLNLIDELFNCFDKNKSVENLESFENEESLIEYYQAVKSLYHGNPELYLEVIGKYL